MNRREITLPVAWRSWLQIRSRRLSSYGRATVFLSASFLVGIQLAAAQNASIHPCVSASAPAEQGRAELDQREFDRAIVDFRKAVTSCPEAKSNLLNLARAYLGAGQDAAAEHIIGGYLKSDPDSEEGQFLLAYALYRQHRFTQSAEGLQKILNRDPGYADALHLMGMTLFFMNDYTNSRKALENSMKVRPNDEEALYFLAGTYYFENMLSQAIRGYRRVLRLNPFSYQAYDALGLSEQAMGKDAEAEADFKRAQQFSGERDPHFVAPYEHLARLFISRGRYGEALPEAHQALRIDPASAVNQYLMGSVLLHTGDFESALDYLNRSAELDKHFPDPHYLLVRAYMKLQRSRDAAREVRILQSLKDKQMQRRARSDPEPAGR